MGNYNPLPERIPADILARFEKLSPAQLCDGMAKLGIPRNGCMDVDLMPVDPDKRMMGTACTVDTMEGDNFPIHVAIYQGQPGYVLVVAGKSYKDRAYIGDLVIGDYDGVTVVPRGMLEEVLRATEEKGAYEIKRREAIAAYAECRRAGKALPNLAPAWVTEMLEKI